MKHTDLLLQKWKKQEIKVDFQDDKRKENWAKYQCKSCDWELYFISSSSVWYVGDFFKLLLLLLLEPQQEHSRPTVILNKHIAVQMMKAGSLWHYAASLLQLYYICRGPLKPSIFIGNVGLYTYPHTFSLYMCVCGGVLWQLNAVQVFLACWGHRQQPLWRSGW